MIKKFYTPIAIALLAALTACGDGSTGSKEQNAAPAEAQKVENTVSKAETREHRTIKLAYLPITHSLAGFEAAETERLKKETGLDIELVKFGSWTELMDALNTGRVDAAVALVELVMKAREQGIDVYLTSLAHRDGNVIVVGNDIQSVADLKGRTFAIPHRQSSHYILLNEALAKEGVDINDITITELAPPEMPSALASGQIAGYCVAEPFGAKAVSLNIGKVLFNSKDLWPDSICCGLALSGKFLSEHPELASQLVRAVREAGLNLEHDHEHEKELAAKYFKVSKDTLDVSLQWISFDNLEIKKENYDILSEKVKKYGLSENPVPYEDIVKNVE
ncbi:MAG: ABC transporter substrate-binding protein [Ruminobacter sp.]|jgi:NitT/TauT family transport system substrate-binding protein|uniref:NitT/TauT family transport system substrate-binding protein n=1 Tax=Ruminobacter amylophilus TaxID=867 RepID=A0A662ZER8_9GAMM|nr:MULTISPECIES: ABC transporter substrate-binding protein [Ruminobacter]MBQ3775995.1 ABC transporter substrate-binding protein [Ruminobacter sp.]SFP07735.1 NitT/TauT family transport system substrate-binding protein [Ruminobacter amylophilus]